MAAMQLAKKALFRTSKSLPSDSPVYLQATRRCWNAPFSTAYDHAESTNAVAEGRNVTSVLPETTADTKNASTYESKGHTQDINIDDMSGVTGFVADTAREGAVKAFDTAEAAVDTAKQAMDSAFDVTKKVTEDVKHTTVAEADNNVVDTAEYRSIQDAAKPTETQDEQH